MQGLDNIKLTPKSKVKRLSGDTLGYNELLILIQQYSESKGYDVKIKPKYYFTTDMIEELFIDNMGTEKFNRYLKYKYLMNFIQFIHPITKESVLSVGNIYNKWLHAITVVDGLSKLYGGLNDTEDIRKKIEKSLSKYDENTKEHNSLAILDNFFHSVIGHVINMSINSFEKDRTVNEAKNDIERDITEVIENLYFILSYETTLTVIEKMFKLDLKAFSFIDEADQSITGTTLTSICHLIEHTNKEITNMDLKTITQKYKNYFPIGELPLLYVKDIKKLINPKYIKENFIRLEVTSSVYGKELFTSKVLMNYKAPKFKRVQEVIK